MVKASRGLRRKTRHILRRKPRERGLTPITHEFQQFEVGEKVSVVINPSIHKGMPHSRFQGKTGVVKGQQGNSWVVSLHDGDKEKTVVARAEHLKRSS